MFRKNPIEKKWGYKCIKKIQLKKKVGVKIYKENQLKKNYIWHYGIMKKLKSQMNSKMKKKF